jgi:predicted negative regulator of RcsB-dependent stress response
VAVLLAVIIILSAALWSAHQRHQQASRLYTQRLEEQDEEQMVSSAIRLPEHY